MPTRLTGKLERQRLRDKHRVQIDQHGRFFRGIPREIIELYVANLQRVPGELLRERQKTLHGRADFTPSAVQDETPTENGREVLHDEAVSASPDEFWVKNVRDVAEREER